MLVGPVLPGAGSATPATPTHTSTPAPSVVLLPPMAPSNADKLANDAEVGNCLHLP